MKKILVSLIVVIVFFTFVNSVSAKTPLNRKNLYTIVELMRNLKVEESKITEIIKILQRDSAPVVSPSRVVPQSNTEGSRCWKYSPCISA